MSVKRSCNTIVNQARKHWEESLHEIGKLCLKIGPTIAPLLLISLDSDEVKKQIQADSKRCDYLFLCCKNNCSKCFVVPIELKGRKPKLSEIIAQLQGGADFAGKIIFPEDNFKLMPVAIAASWRVGALLTLRSKKYISLHNRKVPIKGLKYHDSLKLT